MKIFFFHRHPNHYGQALMKYVFLLCFILIFLLIKKGCFFKPPQPSLPEKQTIKKELPDDHELTEKEPTEPECSCQWEIPEACAPLCCGYGNCSIFERSSYWSCTPPGCEQGSWECTFDDQCCTPWNPIGCGILSTEANCDPGSTTNGQMGYVRQCGDGLKEYNCEDDPDCIFKCLSNLSSDCHSDKCPDSDMGLPSDMCWHAVNQGQCQSNQKCQKQCLGDTIPSSSGCDSVCRCPCNQIPAGGCENHQCRCPKNMQLEKDTQCCVCEEGYLNWQGKCRRIIASPVTECQIDKPLSWQNHPRCPNGYIEIPKSFCSQLNLNYYELLVHQNGCYIPYGFSPCNKSQKSPGCCFHVCLQQ